MPRKWSGLAFEKFCAFPEFIPFQMNLPSEETIVNKPGGINFDYFTAGGAAGPVGKVFVNPHFVSNKSEAFDFSWNSEDMKYNFQGKLEMKKKVMMEKLNIEHEIAGRPLGVLIAADLPFENPAGCEKLDIGVRSAEGQIQAGFRTKVKVAGFELDEPKLELGCQVTDALKVGAQLAYKFDKETKGTDQLIGFRAFTKEAGFTVAAHVQLKAKQFDEATITCMAPKFTCPVIEKPLVLTGQVKVQGTKVTEMKAVAETKICDGFDLKFKASKAPKHEQGQLTLSTIFRKIPGDFDLTLGATCNMKDYGIQYGALLQHGYYSFVGW